MPITVYCQSCQQEFDVNDELAGQTVKCPTCHINIKVTGRKLEITEDKSALDIAREKEALLNKMKIGIISDKLVANANMFRLTWNITTLIFMIISIFWIFTTFFSNTALSTSNNFSGIIGIGWIILMVLTGCSSYAIGLIVHSAAQLAAAKADPKFIQRNNI